MCSLAPLLFHPHLSLRGPNWGRPPLPGHRLLGQKGLLCLLILMVGP